MPRPASTTLFETERLRCRRWVPDDFEVLYALYSDAEAMRWVGDGRPITRVECQNWFSVTEANYARRGYGMFALEERASGLAAGFCGLVHPGGQPEPEIKYAVMRSRWGHGLASEAVPAFLNYGSKCHSLSRIIATVASGNLASQRVVVKAGMRFVQARQDEDGSVTQVYEWHASSAD